MSTLTIDKERREPPPLTTSGGKSRVASSARAHQTARSRKKGKGHEESRNEDILNDFAFLLEQIDPKKRRQVCEHDLTKHLYSTLHLPGADPSSGAECAERLLSFDANYSLPRDEIDYVERNKGDLNLYFQSLWPDTPITFVSLGCGPYHPVVSKEVPLARAVGASRYIAIDYSERYARTAAGLVHELMNIPTSYLSTDFSAPFNLPRAATNGIVFFSLFGDTIGQFSTKSDNKNGTADSLSPFEKLLINLGKATNFKSVLFATFDTERHGPSLVTKYQGKGMRTLMDTLMLTAKAVTKDPAFTPCALEYAPYFDEKTTTLRFAYDAKDDTSLTVRNKKYIIPYGTRLVIGGSQKNEPQDVLPYCANAGWSELTGYPTPCLNSTARALILSGRNLPNLQSRHP